MVHRVAALKDASHLALLEAGGRDPRQILALFAEAGRGLAAAHDAGITHGCFSPASCVVGRDGR